MTTHLPSKNKRTLLLTSLGIAIASGAFWAYSKHHQTSGHLDAGWSPAPATPDTATNAEHATTATQISEQKAHEDVTTPNTAAANPAASAAAVTQDTAQSKISETAAAKDSVPTSAPADTCFVATYQREKESKSFVDNEEWAQQRNLVRIGKNEINHESVCVRVNGTPVKHEWTQKGLLFGPVAGPGAKITVRYCMGKEQCKEDCKIPKDEFMAALGTDDDSAADTKEKSAKGNKKAGRWAAADGAANVGNSVEAEMAKELADQSDLVVFDGWSGKGEHPACTRRVAANTK